jgi:hypothetical protein
METGVNCYIEKPVDPDYILQKIESNFYKEEF